MNKNTVPVSRVKFSKERLFKSLNFKVGLGYGVVAVAAIGAFYYAKQDITENRLKNMRLKEEIQQLPIEKSERFQRIIDKNRIFEEKQRQNEHGNK